MENNARKSKKVLPIIAVLIVGLLATGIYTMTHRTQALYSMPAISNASVTKEDQLTNTRGWSVEDAIIVTGAYNYADENSVLKYSLNGEYEHFTMNYSMANGSRGAYKLYVYSDKNKTEPLYTSGTMDELSGMGTVSVDVTDVDTLTICVVSDYGDDIQDTRKIAISDAYLYRSFGDHTKNRSLAAISEGQASRAAFTKNNEFVTPIRVMASEKTTIWYLFYSSLDGVVSDTLVSGAIVSRDGKAALYLFEETPLSAFEALSDEDILARLPELDRAYYDQVVESGEFIVSDYKKPIMETIEYDFDELYAEDNDLRSLPVSSPWGYSKSVFNMGIRISSNQVYSSGVDDSWYCGFSISGNDHAGIIFRTEEIGRLVDDSTYSNYAVLQQWD